MKQLLLLLCLTLISACGSQGSGGGSGSGNKSSQKKLYVVGDFIGGHGFLNSSFGDQVAKAINYEPVIYSSESTNSFVTLSGALKQAYTNNLYWDFHWSQNPPQAGDILILAIGYSDGLNAGFSNNLLLFTESFKGLVKQFGLRGVKILLLTPPYYHVSLTGFRDSIISNLNTIIQNNNLGSYVKTIPFYFDENGTFKGAFQTNRSNASDFLYNSSDRSLITQAHHDLIAKDVIYHLTGSTF